MEMRFRRLRKKKGHFKPARSFRFRLGGNPVFRDSLIAELCHGCSTNPLDGDESQTKYEMPGNLKDYRDVRRDAGKV